MLTPSDISRYSRQVLLPEIGIEGQEKLKEASVLVIGAGGLTGRPNVYASIFRFDGQVSVFGAPEGPCYRCLYPEPPPARDARFAENHLRLQN